MRFFPLLRDRDKMRRRRSKREGRPEVVVVGSVALDRIQTPFETRRDVLGGSLTYAAMASSRFAPTGIVGVVGADFPSCWMTLFEKSGIDVRGLVSKPGRTFRWSGVYENDMISRRTLATELNVFADFNPKLPLEYTSAPFILLGNISPALQVYVLEQVRRPRFVVADTMNLWINTQRRLVKKLVSLVDALMLNDEEARLLAERHSLSACAELLLSWGPSHLVIKKGEHGAMLFSRRGIFLVPAYPVTKPRDPTGAGDTFAGAFIGALAASGRVSDGAVRDALVWGSVMASFCVENFGADKLAMVGQRNIVRRRRDLMRMISV